MLKWGKAVRDSGATMDDGHERNDEEHILAVKFGAATAGAGAPEIVRRVFGRRGFRSVTRHIMADTESLGDAAELAGEARSPAEAEHASADHHRSARTDFAKAAMLGQTQAMSTSRAAFDAFVRLGVTMIDP